MTAFFPATRQRHLDRIADAALRQYGLHDTTIRLVANTPNLVFRVAARSDAGQSAEQFALRLSTTNRYSTKAVESEMTWLEAIRRDTSLIVPCPVRNESGSLLTMPATEDFATAHIYTLFRWVDGRVVGGRPSEKLLRKVGQLMAGLHRHGREFAPPPGFYRPHRNCDSMTGRTGALAESWHRLPRNARFVFSKICDRFYPAAQEIGMGTGCFGLIHGALHGANALSRKVDVAAVGFDDCCCGYYLHDIAVMLCSLEFRPNFRELRRAFLSGYCAVCPLLAEHVAQLNLFMAAHWVTVGLTVAREPGNEAAREDTIDRCVAKLRQFLQAPESYG